MLDNLRIAPEQDKISKANKGVNAVASAKMEIIKEEHVMDTSIDYLGRFRDPSLQKAYLIACLKRKSAYSFIPVTLLICGWCIAETLASLIYYSDNKTISITFSIVCFFLIGLSLLLCGVVYVCFASRQYANHNYHGYAQIAFIVSINALFVLKSIERIVSSAPPCIPSAFYIPFANSVLNNPVTNTTGLLNVVPPTLCPPVNSFGSIVSSDMILVMSASPQLLMLILYEPRLYLAVGCHLINSTLMIVSISSSVYTIIPIIIILIILFLLITELHYQRTQSFLGKYRLQELLEQMEKNAEAQQALELRHMIGNVAHDLKTPLASFMSGMEVIKDILASAEEKIRKSDSSVEMFAEFIRPIHSCLANVRNTNAFMLMTINRCIDYTKASKGMKLVPKYETVDLREALQFPIECMSNIQERIEIKLEPLSEEICSHIITDKQWLQENLLCLLSNAVKYSAEGPVEVKVSLIVKDASFEKHFQVPVCAMCAGSADALHPKTQSKCKIFSDNCDGICRNFLLFEIEDNGIGLSEESMSILFNPFNQAQRLAGGTGLGLYSLAKRLDGLKGGYGVRRRRDGKKGSLFWFAIPYRPDQLAANSCMKAAAAQTPILSSRLEIEASFEKQNVIDRRPSSFLGAHSFPQEHCELKLGVILEILVVDDSPSILKMSSMMLKGQGHQIWTAENGEIALKRIEEKWKESGRGFDLVLMDLQMPVMDGLEATRRLRKMESEGRDWILGKTSAGGQYLVCEQIIFGVSANSDHETVNEAFEAGVNEFFGKPFSMAQFNLISRRYFGSD